MTSLRTFGLAAAFIGGLSLSSLPASAMPAGPAPLMRTEAASGAIIQAHWGWHRHWHRHYGLRRHYGWRRHRGWRHRR